MSDNYFQLLGLDVNYNLDQRQLLSNYRQLQSRFHPDNFARASDMEKRLSVQHSSLINDAFQTLKDPIKRAQYQLSLSGIQFKDNETAMDPAFLMEQMEMRERLEAIRGSANPQQQLEQMQQSINDQMSQAIEQIGRLFDNNEHLEPIKTITLKMQFFRKLLSECEELEEQLF